MATSCVSYLCASLELVDERITESESTQKILDSFYGFHLYANEHWIHHILAYDKDICALRPVEVSPLHELIERLTNRHNEQLRWLYREDSPRLANLLSDGQDPPAFLSRYRAFQNGLKKKVGKTGEGETLGIGLISY